MLVQQLNEKNESQIKYRSQTNLVEPQKYSMLQYFGSQHRRHSRPCTADTPALSLVKLKPNMAMESHIVAQAASSA